MNRGTDNCFGTFLTCPRQSFQKPTSGCPLVGPCKDDGWTYSLNQR